MATSPASAFPLVKKLRRPIQALWILGLFLLLASPIATRFKFLTFLEELTLDLRFAVRGEVEPSPGDPPIVLVGIDDSSLEPNLGPLDLASDPWLAEFANSWPWPRSLQGELLRRLLADGARSVAFDVLFYQEGTGDEVFAEELTQAGPRAVLATQWVPVKDPGAIWSYRERLPSDSILPNPYFTQLGFVNIKPDKDGVVRKIVLTTDLAHETLAFTQNAEKAARLETLSRRLPDLPAFSLATAQSSAETFTPPFPLETGKAYRINYAGRSEWFPTLSAIDFFLPDRRDAAASLVRDAMVIIAPMSDHLKDNHPTPLGVSYGAEIHAHALRNLFLDNFLQEPGTGGRAIWLGALSLLTAGAILPPKAWVAKAASS